ncbi:ABC transporter substrate-binding protein, partial [Streptomyces sp. SID11233]|nr:ABC transporter substrate-binding protein [Streptomyces sp. SID11233]
TWRDGRPTKRKEGAKEERTWSLGDAEKLIRRQNEDIGNDYFTVVYAGPLNAPADGTFSATKGTEELGGVALAQGEFNKKHGPDMRVLIANGGVDMSHQVEMAERIAAYARRDPTVVGVVGLGRSLKTTSDAVTTLRHAGLPVVSGTNSAPGMPAAHDNWFSLAAPDDFQARQLAVIAEQLAKEGKTRALLLARRTKGTGDTYTTSQAGQFRKALTDKGPLTLVGSSDYT